MQLAAIAEVRSNPDSDTGLIRFHVVLPEAQVRQVAWANVLARVPVVVVIMAAESSLIHSIMLGLVYCFYETANGKINN